MRIACVNASIPVKSTKHISLVPFDLLIYNAGNSWSN